MIQPPPLQIRSLRHLYRHDFDMPENMVRQILSQPRETLVEDLQQILRDAIDNYDQYRKEAEKLKYWTQLHAPLHAIYFLGELGAAEALPVVEAFMAQDGDRLNFWLHGDSLTDWIWEPLLRMVQPDIEQLFAFAYRDDTYVFARAAFLTAIAHYLYHHPAEKERVIPHYRELLRYYIDKLAPLEEWVDDMYVPSFAIWEIAELKIHELDDLIQEAIDKDCIITDEIPDLERLHQRPEDAPTFLKTTLFSVYERYQDAVNTWYKDYIVDEP